MSDPTTTPSQELLVWGSPIIIREFQEHASRRRLTSSQWYQELLQRFVNNPPSVDALKDPDEDSAFSDFTVWSVVQPEDDQWKVCQQLTHFVIAHSPQDWTAEQSLRAALWYGVEQDVFEESQWDDHVMDHPDVSTPAYVASQDVSPVAPSTPPGKDEVAVTENDETSIENIEGTPITSEDIPEDTSTPSTIKDLPQIFTLVGSPELLATIMDAAHSHDWSLKQFMDQALRYAVAHDNEIAWGDQSDPWLRPGPGGRRTTNFFDMSTKTDDDAELIENYKTVRESHAEPSSRLMRAASTSFLASINWPLNPPAKKGTTTTVDFVPERFVLRNRRKKELTPEQSLWTTLSQQVSLEDVISSLLLADDVLQKQMNRIGDQKREELLMAQIQQRKALLQKLRARLNKAAVTVSQS